MSAWQPVRFELHLAVGLMHSQMPLMQSLCLSRALHSRALVQALPNEVAALRGLTLCWAAFG